MQASSYDGVPTSSALNAAAVDYNNVLTAATRDTAVDYHSVLTAAGGGGDDYDRSASVGAEPAVTMRNARHHGGTAARGASGGGLGQRASTYNGFDDVSNGVTTGDYASTLTTASTTGGGGTDYNSVLTEAPVR